MLGTSGLALGVALVWGFVKMTDGGPGSTVGDPREESATAPTPGSPRLFLPASTLELGTLREGDERRHRFEIRNEGSSPLRILKAQPSCGCITVTYDKTIQAGTGGGLEMQLRTAGLVGTFQ